MHAASASQDLTLNWSASVAGTAWASAIHPAKTRSEPATHARLPRARRSAFLSDSSASAAVLIASAMRKVRRRRHARITVPRSPPIQASAHDESRTCTGSSSLFNGLAALGALAVAVAIAISAYGAFRGNRATAGPGTVESGAITIRMKGLAFPDGTRTITPERR